MKKLLLISFMFWIVFAKAQVTQEKEEISLDEMLRHVDQSTFKSGILYDRTTPYAALTKFNAPENKEAASYAYFRQVLLEMHNASNKKYFISSTALREKQKHKTSYDAIDLGIINVSYEVLNYNEDDNSKGALKITKNKFKKINDAPPFITHHSLVIAPLKRGTYGPKVTFRLSNQNWFQNASSKKIKSLTVDTGNGKTELLIKDSRITKSIFSGIYKTSGTKVITFNAVFADGSKLETKGEFYVVIKAKGTGCTTSSTIENDTVIADITFKGYEPESVALLGQSEYRIFFRANEFNKKLKKPIIIIDGFDPLNRRRIQDCDCEMDPECASLSDYLTNGVFDPEKHRSIEDFNEYQDSNGSHKLIDSLNLIGYDVVIVNHHKYIVNGHEINGGGDYIERNGLVLTKLIRDLNKRVGTSFPSSKDGLVIIGPSMGGQISRYALAYMEKKYADTKEAQWKHNTRLWISIDSPHLGANIPLGIQALLNMVASTGNDQAIEFVVDQLHSPAARQQLIEQFNGTIGDILKQDYLNARTISQGFSKTRGHPFFIEFYDALFNNGLPNSNGYPQNLRKIALINGSILGTRTYANPYQLKGYDLSGTLTDAVFAPSSSKTYYSKTLDITGIKNTFGVKNVVARIHSYSMPSFNQSSKIARFYRFILPSYNRHLYVVNNNSRGNMDNVSGGWFPTQQTIAKSTIENKPSFGISWYELRKINHCNSFISAYSAIGHKNPDQSWAAPLNYNMICADDTPFDSYFGHEKNTQHTSFNKENVHWLFQELKGITQDPTVYLGASDLIGDDAICLNENVTYHFDDCRVPSDATWEVSNLQMISSTNTSITVRATSQYATQGTIKATFSNGWITEKTITLPGDPVVYLPTDAQGEMIYELCSEQGTFITLINEDEVVIDLSNGVEIFPEIDNFEYEIIDNEISITPHPSADEIFFSIKVKDHCGAWPFEEIYMSFTVANCYSGYSSYKIYPNPVSSTLTIENIKSTVENYNKNASFQLSDDYGNVIHRGQIQALATLNLSKFRNGMYILRIISDANVETHKIMVEHEEK